jgi:hypothetical protein
MNLNIFFLLNLYSHSTFTAPDANQNLWKCFYFSVVFRLMLYFVFNKKCHDIEVTTTSSGPFNRFLFLYIFFDA